MYGKVMSVPDKAMGTYFRLVTRWSVSLIDELEKGMADGKLHPRDVKMKLAREIVGIYYGEKEAVTAEEAFVRVFQKGSAPEGIPEWTLQPGQTVVDVLLSGNLVSTRGEGKRLIEQNGVRLDGVTLTDPNQVFPHVGVLQAGKRRFLRVV